MQRFLAHHHFPLKNSTIKQTSRKSSGCLFWIQLMSTTRWLLEELKEPTWAAALWRAGLRLHGLLKRTSGYKRVPEINAIFVSHTHTHTSVQCIRLQRNTSEVFIPRRLIQNLIFASLLNFHGQHMKTASVVYQSWIKDYIFIRALMKPLKRVSQTTCQQLWTCWDSLSWTNRLLYSCFKRSKKQK